jgi:pyruvate/2-oxoglutarate dehydrogenase complex dihydrolipoamide acyltransferase (E2) component
MGSGTIQSIFVSEGDTVAIGTPLFQNRKKNLQKRLPHTRKKTPPLGPSHRYRLRTGAAGTGSSAGMDKL